MDKELIRVIIIAIGLLVITGMLLWSYLKNSNGEKIESLFGRAVPKPKNPSPMRAHQAKQLADEIDKEDFNTVPNKAATYNEDIAPLELFDKPLYEETIDFAENEDDSAPRFNVPEIIQFSIKAKSPNEFNGLALYNAFNIAGLIYGSLKIYERLDATRLVDFGVASLASPGTFPDLDADLEPYTTPGLVFFMQPNVLDNPQAVFDDFVDTLRLMAVELDGEMLDHEHNPLTEETIRLFRQSL